MGIHAKSLNALAGLDEDSDCLVKYFVDYTNPQPAKQSVKKSAREEKFDELDQALAVLKKGVNKDPAPETVAKTTKARPKVTTDQSVGDQSLGVRSEAIAKAAADVDLYGTMASVGDMESANAKVVKTAKTANGQSISKAADEDDDDDPIGGIMI